MKIPENIGASYAYVYSCPEKWGLEEVAQIDYSDGNYNFDYRVVWLDREKKCLWSGRDAGCSCPAPFEDFLKESDFERVNQAWIDNVLEPELKKESRPEYEGAHYTPKHECDEFFAKVKKAFRGPKD